MVWRGGLLLMPALLFLIAPNLAEAQKRNDVSPRTQQAMDWTIGVAAGTLDGTALRLANEIALALNDPPDLRIVPMVNENAIQNIADLLQSQRVDAAIVQSDVLAYMQRTDLMPGIKDQLQYVAKLHSEEFHVLSRMTHLCLGDLTGRKVNFGPVGSASALTAQTVFEVSGVQVEPQYFPHHIAARKLKKGELDAIVFVSGKPSAGFESLRYTDGVHFLDVDFTNKVRDDYLPAILTHDDYPDLIAPEETVNTVAVSTVIAVMKSGVKSERHLKLERFVDRFFSNIEKLREAPNHVKWKEVALSSAAGEWTRFPPAQQWLNNHSGSSAVNDGNAMASTFKASELNNLANIDTSEATKILGDLETFGNSSNTSSAQDRKKLFNDFMRWYQQENRHQYRP